MAENNLNNDPNVSNFLSSLNAVFSALRGTFAPRNNAGDVGDGAADLGSSTNSWARAYIQTLIVGGAEVDLASVAVGAAVFVFDATECKLCVAWQSDEMFGDCVFGCWSGGKVSYRRNGHGWRRNNCNQRRQCNTDFEERLQLDALATHMQNCSSRCRKQAWGNTCGSGNATSAVGLGTQRARTRIFTGLSQGNAFNVQIGAGGAGGAGGGAAGDDGFALLFAF